MTKHDPFRRESMVIAIQEYIEVYGHPPTIRELVKATGLKSTAAVHYHLKKLVQQGDIRKCEDDCGRYWA